MIKFIFYYSLCKQINNESLFRSIDDIELAEEDARMAPRPDLLKTNSVSASFHYFSDPGTYTINYNSGIIVQKGFRFGTVNPLNKYLRL
jgi:hypothetical protein